MSDAFATKYGPWALVTGAAQGIGRAFAAELCSRGLDLVLVDIRGDALGDTAAALRAKGAQVATWVGDLAAPASVAEIRAAVGDRDVGLLVCSAAHVPTGPFLDDSPQNHATAVAVNTLATVALTHAFARPMRDRGRGGVVLLASMAALQGTGWVATYAATKAFNLVLAESLWWELRGDGVDCLAVLPGATDTEGLRRNSPFATDPAALARPEDVATEALDALGRSASWVCGEQNRTVAEALRTLPREQVIDLVSTATRRMTAGPEA